MLVHASQVTPQYFVAGTHLYSWVERGTRTGKVSCPRTQHNNPRQTNALTIRPPHLPCVTSRMLCTYVTSIFVFATLALHEITQLFKGSVLLHFLYMFLLFYFTWNHKVSTHSHLVNYQVPTNDQRLDQYSVYIPKHSR